MVNYDLPWAIIRLIQRAGRVDRVGQTSDSVLLYSFFHESVDNVIALRQRISARLHANAEAFGSDEQFFGSDTEVKAITDLYNGSLDNQDSADDVDASSLAYQRALLDGFEAELLGGLDADEAKSFVTMLQRVSEHVGLHHDIHPGLKS